MSEGGREVGREGERYKEGQREIGREIVAGSNKY